REALALLASGTRARRELALLLERDRHREVRDAVQEVGGAVQRIDDEAWRAGRSVAITVTLLEKLEVGGIRAGQHATDDLLRSEVGARDEVACGFLVHSHVLGAGGLVAPQLRGAPGCA